MTIITDRPQDTTAEQPVRPSFRLKGGPLPYGKPRSHHVDTKDQGDQIDTWNRDYSRAHPCKLRLPFSQVLQGHRDLSLVYTSYYDL